MPVDLPLAEDGRPIALVASDLDGTLLTDGILAPRPEALERIRDLSARGVRCFAASGRQPASLRRMFEPVADQMGYVCENGALVIIGGKPVVIREIDRALALRVAHMVDDYPGASLLVSGVERCYIKEGNPALYHNLRYEVKNDVSLYREPEDVAEPIIKLAFHIDNEHRDAASAHFARLLKGDFAVVTSGTTWIDFLPHGVNKGTALAAVGDYLGIDPADMAAFGDNENDREMLDLVGHPYLMETCNPTMRGLNDRIRYVESVEGELRRLLAR